MIQDAITNLPLEGFPRRERFREKYRIGVGDDVLEGISIGESEAFGHLELIAVLVT